MNLRAFAIGASPSPEPSGSDPPSGVRRVVRPGAVNEELLAFIRSEAPSVKVIARRFRVSAEVAQDIRQDTLEAMVQAAEPIRFPRAWFWEAAHRRRLRVVHWQRRTRRFESALEVLAQRQPPAFLSPDESLEQGDRRRAMVEVLDHVKPSRRDVTQLHVLGYNESEIAVALNLPVGTVRSRLQRAKEDAKAQWAALVALLAALWLWLVSSRGRSGGGGGGGDTTDGRDAGDAGDAGAQRRGRRLLACAACFVVPFTLATHDGPPPPWLTEEAVDVSPSDRWLTFSPILTTNAEREREALSPVPRPVSLGTAGRSRSAVAPLGDGPGSGAAAASSPSGRLSDEEAARRHLIQVHYLLSVRHDRQAARQFFELYRLTYAHDPFPGKAAALAAMLREP